MTNETTRPCASCSPWAARSREGSRKRSGHAGRVTETTNARIAAALIPS